MRNKTLVSESLENVLKEEEFGGISSFLKPRTKTEVTAEIQRRLNDKKNDMEILLQKEDFIIYKIEKSDLIKDIVKNFGGRDEDIFYNFYLILDNSVTGFRQIIGVKVSPDGTLNAMDAKGTKVETEYLEKFS